MLWYLLPVIAAVLGAAKYAGLKFATTKMHDQVALWTLSLSAAMVLWTIALMEGIPYPDTTFWLALLAVAPTSIASVGLQARALKVSDMSLVSPLVNLSPVFLLFLAPLLVDEHLTFQGIVGVLVIVVGTYMLNNTRKEDRQGALDPFRALWEDRGARLMLLAVLCMAANNILDKLGVNATGSGLLWAATIQTVWVVAFTPAAIIRRRESQEGAPWKLLLLLGALGGIGSWAYAASLVHIPVTYAVSIKKLGAIFSVFAGHLLFKEGRVQIRLAGASVMIIGVILIITS